jgi:hypothetical protein
MIVSDGAEGVQVGVIVAWNVFGRTEENYIKISKDC